MARPPGVSELTLKGCTRCGACVDSCPETILRLAPDGVMLNPEAGECTFCGKCAASCPETVFAEIVFVDTDHMAHEMGHVMQISARCFVEAGISCMTCRDACPQEAISMKPRVGGPFLPLLDAAACTGCAACSSVCPAGAIDAVRKDVSYA